MSIQAVIVNGRDGKVVALSTWETRRRRPRPRAPRTCSRRSRASCPARRSARACVITSTADRRVRRPGQRRASASRRTTRSSSSSTSSRPPSRSTRPHGKAVAPKKGLPTVTMNEGKPATITVPKGVKAPTKTVVQPLIEGNGAEVKKGQTVRVAYTGALCKDGSVFDSSASRPEQPYFDFPIGAGPGHQGLGQRPQRPEGRQPRAPRHPAGRRLRRRPAARRRSPATTPWCSSSTSSPRTDPRRTDRSTRARTVHERSLR